MGVTGMLPLVGPESFRAEHHDHGQQYQKFTAGTPWPPPVPESLESGIAEQGLLVTSGQLNLVLFSSFWSFLCPLNKKTAFSGPFWSRQHRMVNLLMS